MVTCNRRRGEAALTTGGRGALRRGGYLAEAGTLGKVLLVAGWAAAVSPSSADDAAPALLMHRATYEIGVGQRSASAAATSAHGMMVTSVEDACDSWRTRQGLVLTMVRDDAAFSTASDLDSSEAKDGTWYTFADDTQTEPGEAERSAGEARVEDDVARLRLLAPAEQSTALPQGTIFPLAHLLDLLRGAQAGERMLSHTLFDGTDGATVYDVTTLVGEPHPSADNGLDVWPLQLAFFIHGSAVETPDLEISADLRADGVAEALAFDYGTFILEAKLTGLEQLPPPDC